MRGRIRFNPASRAELVEEFAGESPGAYAGSGNDDTFADFKRSVENRLLRHRPSGDDARAVELFTTGRYARVEDTRNAEDELLARCAGYDCDYQSCVVLETRPKPGFVYVLFGERRGVDDPDALAEELHSSLINAFGRRDG